MDTSIVSHRSRRRSRNKVFSADFIKKINQENLLVELSERIQLEMERLGLTESDLQELLSVNEAYVQGLLHGFANITLRELADVFTSFDRLVQLVPFERSSLAVRGEASLKSYRVYVSENSLRKVRQVIGEHKDWSSSITITFQSCNQKLPINGWSASRAIGMLEDKQRDFFSVETLNKKSAINEVCI